MSLCHYDIIFPHKFTFEVWNIVFMTFYKVNDAD